MGKIAFFSICDQEGLIQLYLDKLIIDNPHISDKLLSSPTARTCWPYFMLFGVLGWGHGPVLRDLVPVGLAQERKDSTQG